MKKILIRIFIGLVSVITVLGLFSLGLVKVSNQVREEHYWHDLLVTPMTELSRVISEDHSKLPEHTYLSDYESLGLSAVEQERLMYGRLLVSLEGDYLRAIIQQQNSSEQLLVFESLRDKQFSALFRLLVSELLVDATELSKLESIESLLNVSIAKLEETSSVSSQLVLNDIAKQGFHDGLDEDGLFSYVRLKSGELLRLEYGEVFSGFSFILFVALVSLCVAVLMLFVYYLVEGFSRRLRSIETAASRISRGELDARVSGAGSEDAISRLGGAFNSMADHIQRLMYVQKEMIHAVSHELRTPVAIIRFGVQMIEDCPSEEALQKQVKGIDGDIQELDELIDEILTYARLEQGGPILAFQEADISAIVDQVVSEQGLVKPDMSIFSEFKEGSDVWKMSEVETRYIHRSIQNLVGNATRYAQGRVKVVCSFDAETCRVDVEDDGPGIPEEDWESVFTPFARLDDSRTRASGGYGLGLSIVRRILYWHGGQAFLGRSDMGGAKFSLVWPRKQSQTNKP